MLLSGCWLAGSPALAQQLRDASRPSRIVQIDSPRLGSLSGRLTDLHSTPLAGVSLAVRNRSTGAEWHAITAKNGAFRFASLDAGDYVLQVSDPRLGRGRLEGIVVSGGMESRVQAAVQFEPVPPGASPPALFASVPPSLPVLPATAPAQAAAAAAPTALAVASSNSPGQPSVSLPRIAPPPTTVPGPAFVMPAIRPPASATPRPVIETQSAAIAPSLALAAPRRLSLPFRPSLAFTVNAAAAGSIKAAMLRNLSHLGPVVAAAQQPEPASPAVTATITSAQLQALPASGRRWQQFLLDTPAASASADSAQPSFRAAGGQSAVITIDGAGTQLAFGVAARADASSSTSLTVEEETSPGYGRTAAHGLNVSEAAVREVTATAGNAEAEIMRSSGGEVGIHTLSGSDLLHGQSFLFDRQNSWGARNPFTQWVTETAPAQLTYNPSGPPLSVPVFDNGPAGTPESYTPPDHEIVWGIGAGSRIRRDRLFWFGALDSYRRSDPGVAMVKHPYLQAPANCGTPPCATTTTGFFAQPSNCQMQLLSAQLGLSAPGSSSDCVSGLIQGLTAYSEMLGTSAGQPGLASLLGPAPRTAAQWVGFGRIDWQAAERHRVTLEGTGANWNSPGGGLTGVAANYGNHSFGSSQADQQWLLARWEAYLTPNLLAVTQGSAGRAVLSAKPDTPSAFESPLMKVNPYGQLPQIVVDSRYGFTIGNPARFGHGSYPDENLYHAQEMLDWVRGHLLVRSGFELDHDADAISLLRNQTGSYSYSKVQNFIADALVFEKFGLTNLLNPQNPHNCDPTGKLWQNSNGQLMGLGALPCYSHYSQTIGPTNWNLSTNDWAGYTTAQFQPDKLTVLSIGLRWEHEQMPLPLAALVNSGLPQAGKMPDLGNNWGPRLSLAIGDAKSRWPVLRLGYGMYYGRVANATLETALTQTGSFNGDLSFFIRPTDGYSSTDGTSAAPPFPSVLTGQPSSVVKPGAVEFAPNFRNPEVHQAVAAIEKPLPGRLELTASAMLSLGRRLPVFIDTNFDPAVNPGTITTANPGITYTVCDEVNETATGANSSGQSGTTNGPCGNLGLGPIKTATITVPFYASWPFADCAGNPNVNPVTGQCGWLNPNYQQIDQITSKANSTYEGAMVKLTRYGGRGLSLHAHYTYAHAMDWNPNQSPLDPNPANFNLEYGTSNLDVRHSAAVMLVYETPWKLRDFAGRLGNGWMLSGIGQFHSGLPYSMRVTGSLPEEFDDAGNAIVGLRPGMNGSGGDNRYFGLPRNSFRYPQTWKADLRLGRKFHLGETRQLDMLAESFNLFNHQNVTEIETTGYTIEAGSPPSASGAAATNPTLNFLTGLKISSTTGLPVPAFGKPLNINATDFYRERQIQLGLRLRF